MWIDLSDVTVTQIMLESEGKEDGLDLGGIQKDMPDARKSL